MIIYRLSQILQFSQVILITREVQDYETYIFRRIIQISEYRMCLLIIDVKLCFQVLASYTVSVRFCFDSSHSLLVVSH